MADNEDDLLPSQTNGYKPGEKKTLEELATLDAQDGTTLSDFRVIEKVEGVSWSREGWCSGFV